MLKKDSNKRVGLHCGCIVLTLLFLIGCGGLKPVGAGKSGGLYETFYTGETGMQYFIKPLEFESLDTKESLLLDIVFRENEIATDSALVNISVFTTAKFSPGGNVTATTPKGQITFDFERVIFKEKLKNFYEVRLGTKCSPKEIREFIKGDIELLSVMSDQMKYSFQPTKKTKKSLSKISASVVY